ncbi:IS3 family transposase [Paenibacillus sp. 2TAB26]|uniref:IS3 family transposase n=1 Tax=Paenibacillus sp. 2TAB26 TaxID=3233005 RepID=UPI003F990895
MEEYIHFYNNKRRQRKLNNLAPILSTIWNLDQHHRFSICVFPMSTIREALHLL